MIMSASKDPVLRSEADVLGDEVLGADAVVCGDDDPSYEACAALLPPVEGYTFLATGEGPEVFGVDPQGRIGILGTQWGTKPLERVLFDPREHLPPHTPTARQVSVSDGCPPSIEYTFLDPLAALRWQESARACAGEKPGTTDVLVELRVGPPVGGGQGQWFRVSADGARNASGLEYYGPPREIRRDETFSEAMELSLPEAWPREASHASLARAFVTYEGDRPHYGVGHYRASAHDGFPPTTLSMVNACVEWNLLARARRYLDYYLDHFLRPDGTFDYYGPAVSEYGQMLDVIARYARRSRDAEWLRGRLPEIERIAGHLLRLRREGQERFPKGELRHGLVFGSPEADTRNEVNYYFAGDAWTWRGWTEIARALIELGDGPIQQRGRELLAECDAYRAHIESSLAKSIIPGEAPFVPPVAGFDKPFASMTQDRFASYTNYRYWPEMLSAGFLRPEWADAIIEYRRTHGGELLGTSRFEKQLDDWPYAGYAYGLLLRDRVRHFLLGFYGHLAGHCTPGTFTAYEQVSIGGTPRTFVADYCVPVQLVTPLMAKWMLVFEEPDADVLWLCRAIPGRWLAPGQRIEVRAAPTRWGFVDFDIERATHRSIEARILICCHGFPGELRLRLRTPIDLSVARVTVNGEPHDDVDPTGSFIRIVRPKESEFHVTVTL